MVQLRFSIKISEKKLIIIGKFLYYKKNQSQEMFMSWIRIEIRGWICIKVKWKHCLQLKYFIIHQMTKNSNCRVVCSIENSTHKL